MTVGRMGLGLDLSDRQNEKMRDKSFRANGIRAHTFETTPDAK